MYVVGDRIQGKNELTSIHVASYWIQDRKELPYVQFLGDRKTDMPWLQAPRLLYINDTKSSRQSDHTKTS